MHSSFLCFLSENVSKSLLASFIYALGLGFVYSLYQLGLPANKVQMLENC